MTSAACTSIHFAFVVCSQCGATASKVSSWDRIRWSFAPKLSSDLLQGLFSRCRAIDGPRPAAGRIRTKRQDTFVSDAAVFEMPELRTCGLNEQIKTSSIGKLVVITHRLSSVNRCVRHSHGTRSLERVPQIDFSYPKKYPWMLTLGRDFQDQLGRNSALER